MRYTLNPKKHEYSDETKELALKMYYSGVSRRGVGKVLGMNKANIYNWIKKLRKDNIKTSYEYFELDELYWFIEKKSCTEAHENIYIMTIVSREPRQIIGFDIAFDKSHERIQNIIDGINANIRHYVPVLARSLEKLKAVVAVFVDACNRFGLVKYKYRQCKKGDELLFSVIYFL